MDYNKIEYLKALIDSKQEKVGILEAIKQITIEEKIFPFSTLRNDPAIKSKIKDTDTK